jgi:predicted amidohydrolase
VTAGLLVEQERSYTRPAQTEREGHTVERIRVAAIQYYIRPVQSFEQFRDQVTGLVETAKDYQCHLAVFPEYFATQLLTLGNTRRPMPEQVRLLAKQAPAFLDLMGALARRYKMYIVAGSIPVAGKAKGVVHNDSYFFSPAGKQGLQGKLHMTRFETEEWKVSPRQRLRVFDTDFGRVAITICYDVEFPELARVAAQQGAYILIVPSCTDDRQGFLRVRYCAHARAIENQMYVIHSPTVGSLPTVPAVSLNYGQASILTPSDFPFARDGILAEGVVNQEMMIVGELNLKTIRESRKSGTVLPLHDSKRTAEVASSLKVVKL